MTETRARGRLAGLVFVLVWLSCAWFGSWEWNPNNATRLFAALSIVEEGDATIDQYAGLTIDKARFGDHYYLDKAPGVTLMALPAVAVADAVTGERSTDVTLSQWYPPAERYIRLRMRLASATGAALLTAIAAVLIFLMGARTGGSNAAGLFASAAFALGTPMWGWSTTLFGHAPVAALFVIAIWGIWRGTQDARPAGGHALLAGAALGWAVVVEYPAVLGGAAIAIWALTRLWRYPRADRIRAIGTAAIPAVVAIGILLGYNQFAFGTPFRLGYSGVVGFDGMHQGLFGLTYPKPHVLWAILFGGKRGMIWVAPVLLIAVPGIVCLIRDRATRDLGWLAVAGTVLLFVYNASYAYWDGGNSTGPRHAVPAIAFLALGFAPAWTMLRAGWQRAAALALLALSVAINLVIASAEIATGGRGDFPLWQDVFEARFVQGQLRTIPNEWLGWSAWGGLGLYVLIAGAVGAMIVAALRRPLG